MVIYGELDLQVAGARTGREGPQTIAWLWGEHDLATADQLTQFLADVAGVSAELVVDLSEVSFMDASTITVIVGARSRMAEHSRGLTVRSPSSVMERVFRACGLDDLLAVPGEHSAVAEPERGRYALETWVAVVRRDPAPFVETRSAPTELQGSRE